MRQSSWRSLLIGIVTLSFVGTSAVAQVSTPEPVLPEKRAPYGLDTVELPDDPLAISLLFWRLPWSVGGVPVDYAEPITPDVRRFTFSYGEGGPNVGCMTLYGVDVKSVRHIPRFQSVEDVVAAWAVSEPLDDDGFGVVTEYAGRDGDLIWVASTTTNRFISFDLGDHAGPPVPIPVYELRWGTDSSRWLFGAVATTPSGRDALVAAFVSAAGGTPIRPAPVATDATQNAGSLC